MKRSAVAPLLLALAGCAHQLPPPTVGPTAVVESKVPVAVSCVRTMPPRPTLADDVLLLGMSDYALVLTLWSDRLAARQYTAELEATLAACAAAQ